MNITGHKRRAISLIVEKANKYTQIYKFKINRITVRNQKTRWGSCSKQGNLSFNYRITLLPESLAEYIIVHEICHLGEFNHSKKFWSLVEQTIPDYKEKRKALKKIRL